MSLDRRSLLKSLAVAGAAAASGGTLEARDRPGAGARRAGASLRHDALHRLQGLRRGVPRGQRHEARAGKLPGRDLGHADGSERRHEERHQALQERRRVRALLLQGAVHALRRPGLRQRVHARGAAGSASTASSPTTRTSASAAATARWPARSTSRSSSGRRPPRRSSSASSAAIAWPGRRSRNPTGSAAFPRRTVRRAPRSARAPRSSSASATSCWRKPGAGCRVSRTATSRRSTARRTAAARSASTCPTCPFEKLGLPSLSDRPVPDVAQTIQHGVYQGFVAPVALYGLLAAVIFRNRKKAAPGRRAVARRASVMSDRAQPSGGPILTRTVKALLAVVLRRRDRRSLWRLVAGLGRHDGAHRTAIPGASGSRSTSSPAPRSRAAATRWPSSSTS